MSLGDYLGKQPVPQPAQPAPYPLPPGYRTSGFWMTFASLTITILAFFRIVGPGDHQNLISFLGNTLEGIAILLPQVFIVGRYVKLRAEERIAQIQQVHETEKVDSQKQLQELINQQVAIQIALLKQEPPHPERETKPKKTRKVRTPKKGKTNDTI